MSNVSLSPASPDRVAPASPGTIESGELHSRKSLLKKSPSSQQRKAGRRSPTNTRQSQNALIKYGSLLLLVGQMVGLVLLMRYSRTHTGGGDLYLASTAVFMMEVRYRSILTTCTCYGFIACAHSYHILSKLFFIIIYR